VYPYVDALCADADAHDGHDGHDGHESMIDELRVTDGILGHDTPTAFVPVDHGRELSINSAIEFSRTATN
jgi:hypothetical protein